LFFFFQAEDGIRDATVTGVQTCALPILDSSTEVCMITMLDSLSLPSLAFFKDSESSIVIMQTSVELSTAAITSGEKLGGVSMIKIGRASCREREQLLAWAR